jgi:hypothetical protein
MPSDLDRPRIQDMAGLQEVHDPVSGVQCAETGGEETPGDRGEL